MIVEIPFLYRILHTPEGKRKPTHSDVLDAVPVLIEEFSETEAPLAFRAPKAPGFGDQPHPYVHLAGDRLVAPLFGTSVGAPDNASVAATRSTIKDVVRLPAGRRSPFNPFEAVQKIGNAFDAMTAKDLSAFSGSKISEDDRDARIAEIQCYAADFCFVGDTLCRRAGEPVWHAICGDSFAAVVLRHHPMPDDRVYPGAARYRADRLDAALAHAGRKARAVGLDPSLATVEGSLEVLIPEAISFDDEGYALVEAAREGLLWRLKDGAHELDQQMTEFDLALAAGCGNEKTAKAVESLIAWLENEGIEDHIDKLREVVERRQLLPETIARRTAEIDEALAAADMDMLK